MYYDVTDWVAVRGAATKYSIMIGSATRTGKTCTTKLLVLLKIFKFITYLVILLSSNNCPT